MNLVARIRSKIRSVKNYLSVSRYGGYPPIYPKHNEVGLKIHLGSGPINIQGWVNVDVREAPHIHLRSEGFALDEFANGAISEIYMCHVLEHFSFEQARTVLKTMYGKLKPGGVLRLSVPDFDQLITIYHASGNNLDLIKMALMGGQDYEYNYHKSIFNGVFLGDLLLSCGFNHIQTWSTQEDFGIDLGDWSSKGFDTPAGNIPVSLNIKAMKA